MKVFFIQTEKYEKNKALGLFESLRLNNDTDELSTLVVNIVNVPDESMIYADKKACKDIAGYIKNKEADLIVIKDGNLERILAVRLAAELGIQCFVNVREFTTKNNKPDTLFVYSYQSNLLVSRRCGKKAVVTMNVSTDASVCEEHPVYCEEFEVNLAEIKGEYLPKPEGPNGIESSDRVFVCGMGVGTAENAEKVKKLAEKYDAACGATRPVAANGWISSEYVIGISGKTIEPELCVVFGASGSQAFAAGISKSKYIISVNTDMKAAIFENSDEAVEGDCMKLVEKLLEE